MKVLSLPDGGTLSLDRPRIMGILNVTPDSFSDGGRWCDPGAAVEHGLEMARQGADVIDVGGESTRPGAKRLDADQQKRRVIEVIAKLRGELDRDYPHVPISIDTTLCDVAAAALDAAAAIINDVSAGREEPDILQLAATRGAPIVLMHMQGTPGTMQDRPHYRDVVAEIHQFLLDRAAAAQAAGIPSTQIIIDPGIGFGKTKQHNLALLANLQRLAATGYAVLVGTSRKRFMGAICRSPDCQAAPPRELVAATCATTALGIAAGATILRVHDVAANRQAADVAWAIAAADRDDR